MDISKIKLGNTSYDVKDVVARQKLIPILYDDLVTLRNNSQLIPGQQYRITDYQCTTSQNNTRSAGHQFDIIVTADDESHLSEVARAALHEGDTYFQNSDLSKWQLLYGLDNDISKYKWAVPTGGYIMATFDLNKNKFLRKAAGDVEEVAYPYCWSKGSESWFTASETPAVNDVAYANSDGTGSTITIEEFCSAGKGIISRMVDEFNNECPYDFKNIQYLKYSIGSISYSKSIPLNVRTSNRNGSGVWNRLSDKISLGGFDTNCEIVIGNRLNATSYRNSYYNDVDLSEGFYDYRVGEFIVGYIVPDSENWLFTFNILQGVTTIVNVADGSLMKLYESVKINAVQTEGAVSSGAGAFYLNAICFVPSNQREISTINNTAYSHHSTISGRNIVLINAIDSEFEGSYSLIGQINKAICREIYGILAARINGSTLLHANYVSVGEMSNSCVFYAYRVMASGAINNSYLQYVQYVTAIQFYYYTLVDLNHITINVYCNNLDIRTCYYLTLTSDETTSSSSLIKRLILKYLTAGTSSEPTVITHNELMQDAPTTYLPANSQTISV